MTAPAIVLLTDRTDDLRVSRVMYELRDRIQKMRSQHRVGAASVNEKSLQQAVVNLGSDSGEVVIVPMQLAAATQTSDRINAAVAAVTAVSTNVRIATARPIGPSAMLLGAINRRLRAALRDARARELDGLVLAAEPGADVRGSGLLARRARQWSHQHHLPCVTANTTEVSTANALASLRAQGRRHLAVGSLFLGADSNFQLQKEQANRMGAVMAEPLGDEPELVDLILARYAYAAMDLVEIAPERPQPKVSKPDLRVVS
ncbi:sirohydrochlorin chelatase [Parenemella sanctibonifatiensis]|uniref:Cobalamin biosynthesis protein CbiX n=1 Tax=Parenemella sanctibonifatiensis TaxID=2016505 RepID=A0A255ESR3_9ACTN|nr:CbiX/SirB N-terminal domain-containing protein [Parenemella sanctibonifatiensis]OYN86403.1 hypothetical protein CGZ92_08610 [Parenemella sanctibonifatiensis]OYN91163.1 hypothetical protein CGZ91_06800 [Parenemella sanctibonifatiensis]